jgi:hypothetical protein
MSRPPPKPPPARTHPPVHGLVLLPSRLLRFQWQGAVNRAQLPARGHRALPLPACVVFPCHFPPTAKLSLRLLPPNSKTSRPTSPAPFASRRSPKPSRPTSAEPAGPPPLLLRASVGGFLEASRLRSRPSSQEGPSLRAPAWAPRSGGRRGFPFPRVRGA